MYIYEFLPQFDDTFDTLEMIRVSIFPCSSLCIGCLKSWEKRCNPRKEIYERRSNSRESIRNASYRHPEVYAVMFAYSSSCQLPSSPPFPSFSGSPGSHSGLVFCWLVNKYYSQKSSNIVKQLYANILYSNTHTHTRFPSGSDSKESTCSAGDLSSIPGLGRSPQEENGNPLQYSCLGIPSTEEPGGLQSMELQRVRHNQVTNTFTYTYTYVKSN